MEETLYRIVFNGETVPGLAPPEIIEAFAKRFKLREEKARTIVLSGSRTVLKRNLDQHKAQRYSKALRKVGLLVVMEPQNPARAATNPSVELTTSIDIAQSELASAFYDEAPPTSAPAPAPAAQHVGPGLTADWAPCPKCGEPAISPLTGVCQACGVVVERYLARHADQGGTNGTGKDKGGGPARSDNPYAPPAADLSPPDTRGFSGESLRPPRGVPASHGWAWISAGWQLFKEHPWTWVGAYLLYLIITGALGIIPYGIGSLLGMVFGPILIGGLMMGAHLQYRGGGFSVEALFTGLRTRPVPLALVGVAYLGFFILLMGVTALVVFASMALPNPDFIAEVKQAGADPAMTVPLMLLALLCTMLIGVPIGMAVYFAPALVALNEVPVLRAFKLSFQGCWRNILPFLVFGLAALALFAASLLTLGLAVLVLLPVLIIATYMAYRDIYYR